MKLKERNSLPKAWEYKPWPLCGECFWIEPLIDPDPIPCKQCAEKYGLIDAYYEKDGKGEGQ